MIRYCFCGFFFDPGDGHNPPAWKPTVAKYAGVVKTPTFTGTGEGKRTVAVFSTKNMAGALADADIHLMPQATPDAKISTIGTVVKSRLIADLTRNGFDATTVQSADSFRDLINAIGRTIQGDFDHDRQFSINDV